MPGASIEVDDDEVVTPAPATGQEVAAQGGSQESVQQPSQPARDVAAAPVSVPPAPEYTGLLDYYKSTGLDLTGKYQDDKAAAAGLAEAYRQQQSLSSDPYYQQYRQQAPQFHGWLAEQQKAQAAKAAEVAKGPWTPPTSREEWTRLAAQYSERDPQTGQVRLRADTPYDVRQKVEGYANYVDGWREKLFHDPLEALKPLIQQMVQPMLQETTAAYREQVQAQEMVRRNQDWLYQKNEQGMQYDQQGQPVLSREGSIFAGYVQEAQRLGIKGVAEQEHFALKQTHAQLVIESGAGKGQESRAAVVNGNRRPNVGAAAVNGQVPKTVGVGAGDLAKAMREALASEGVADADVASEFANAE